MFNTYQDQNKPWGRLLSGRPFFHLSCMTSCRPPPGFYVWYTPHLEPPEVLCTTCYIFLHIQLSQMPLHEKQAKEDSVHNLDTLQGEP